MRISIAGSTHQAKITGGSRRAQIDILVPSGQSESARTYEYPGFGRLLETRGAQVWA